MITLKDFYKFYPHKCVLNPNTVPNPYFPKTERDCTSKHSLTYAQWSEIIAVYLEELMEYLLKGFRFAMPEFLGALEITKTVDKNTKYMFTNSKDECVRTVVVPTGLEYKPLLKWYKTAVYTKLSNSWFWSIKLLKRSKFSKKLNVKFKKSPTIFNNTTYHR